MTKIKYIPSFCITLDLWTSVLDPDADPVLFDPWMRDPNQGPGMEKSRDRIRIEDPG
jgi:hypothetical protein